MEEQKLELRSAFVAFFFHLLNIRFLVTKTLSSQVSVFFQLISIISLYFFEKGLDLRLFHIEKSEVYFNDSLTLAFGLFAFNMIIYAAYLHSKKVTRLIELFVYTYIPCKLWTWFVFFIYSLITIPLNFYLNQHLVGDFEFYFKAGGFLITIFFPFILLIYYTDRVLKQKKYISSN